MGSKVTGFIKNFNTVLPTISDRKYFGSRRFNYTDSKSKSWHSAKKMREVFMDNKCPHFFS